MLVFDPLEAYNNIRDLHDVECGAYTGIQVHPKYPPIMYDLKIKRIERRMKRRQIRTNPLRRNKNKQLISLKEYMNRFMLYNKHKSYFNTNNKVLDYGLSYMYGKLFDK